MRIACIDNYDSFVFNLVRYLRTTDQIEEVRVFRNTDIDYAYLDECDGILLSPGPGIPNEAGELLKVIDVYHQVKSIFGVCLGHQALGEYFGAKLEQCAVPVHGKSDTLKQVHRSDLFHDLSSEFEVGRYHSWQISLEQDSPLQTIGKSDDGCILGFQHTSLPIFGVQFHPESVLTPAGRTIVNNWINILKNEKGN